jgi:hypothetical protein
MGDVLKLGDGGEAVAELRARLAVRGFVVTTGGDVFDIEVRRAVRGFQASHVDPRGRPLVVDGIVGPLTRWALVNADNEDVLLPAPPLLAIPVAGGSAPGRAALAVAHAEAAAGAREVGGDNSGPWVEKYLNGLVAPPAGWCAGFVSWCFSQLPEPLPFRYTLGARRLRDQFHDHGWLLRPEDPPAPGDLVFWWRGQMAGWMGHVGFVDRFEHGLLYTLEGNKGGFPVPARGFDYVWGSVDRLLGVGRVP